MKDREMERLMNEELDGTTTPEDSARLNRALESREDVRAEYERLGGVFAVLSQVGMEDPPAELKQGVLRRIRERESAPAREGWIESIAAAFRGRPRFAYAYSFASGAALGVLAVALLTGNLMTRPGSDSRPFTGTMAPPPNASSYQRISSRDFLLRGGRVQAETLSGREGILARITAQAPRGTEIIVSFDPGDWSAEAVRQNPAGNEVMLGFGRLSVRMQKFGESQYLLYLARRGPVGSPLRIAIHSPDGLVHGELETGAPRSGS
jgi:hypothetical protein